jgi:uncharacterized membrane protein
MLSRVVSGEESMTRHFAKEAFGWGAVLWLVGYALGVLLILFVPPSAVGWIILPIGVAVTWWVLMHKVHEDAAMRYAAIAIVWTTIAVILDYLFIVKAFHPVDGYYKLDVYVYYGLTFLLPLIAARQKSMRHAVGT